MFHIFFRFSNHPQFHFLTFAASLNLPTIVHKDVAVEECEATRLYLYTIAGVTKELIPFATI